MDLDSTAKFILEPVDIKLEPCEEEYTAYNDNTEGTSIKYCKSVSGESTDTAYSDNEVRTMDMDATAKIILEPVHIKLEPCEEEYTAYKDNNEGASIEYCKSPPGESTDTAYSDNEAYDPINLKLLSNLDDIKHNPDYDPNPDFVVNNECDIGRFFECLICHKLYTKKRTLRHHIALHDPRYVCTICSSPCGFPSRLAEHMRTHIADKPYGCNICQFRSRKKGNLTVHMRTHTGEKPYGCDMCQYRTMYKTHLKVHMRRHTGEKPYGCNICQYRCTDKSQLTSHMRRHTGLKPYQCNMCKYRSTHKGHIKIHMRTHTRETYECDICHRRFIYNYQFTMHMRTHTAV